MQKKYILNFQTGLGYYYVLYCKFQPFKKWHSIKNLDETEAKVILQMFSLENVASLHYNGFLHISTKFLLKMLHCGCLMEFLERAILKRLSSCSWVHSWLPIDVDLCLPRPNASNQINHWAGLLFNPCSDHQKFKLMVSLFYIMKIQTCYVKLSFCLTKRKASFNHSESLLYSLVKLLSHTWETIKSYCKFVFGMDSGCADF